MPPSHIPEYVASLINELRGLASETEWAEFKVNNSDPRTIGENISALSNGAALNGKTSAYIVWGIEDSTHNLVGTDFYPATAKRGNEPLENWLHRLLNPQIDFRFYETRIGDKRVVLLEIEPAAHSPVAFSGVEYVRVGSATKRLREHTEKARALWRIFDMVNFESGVAVERVSGEDVLLKLDYPAYFRLLEMPLPDGRAAILDALKRDGLIAPCDAGGWNITNLGAILFANRLGDFPRLGRKALRIIQYAGAGRIETVREQEHEKGYAAGFEEMTEYIATLIPSREVIGRSLRRTVPMFPELAIRELVANSLIHQDFFATGTGPMVEIFSGRIEITNPGEPLVDTARFVDTPPKSRNETLAALMRRFGICEERGSGIDKVVLEVELRQLPAPLFEAPGEFTRAALFAHKDLSFMDRSERVRACYLHACIRYVEGLPVNNTSIRERFGISRKNSAQASRILREALDEGAIVIRDPEAGNRNRAYLPHWASSHDE